MSEPTRSHQEASLRALVAALEVGRPDRLPVDAMAEPWAELARIALERPGTPPGAVAWASSLTPETLSRAGIDRSEALLQQFRPALRGEAPLDVDSALRDLAAAADADLALIRAGGAILAATDGMRPGGPPRVPPTIITASDVTPEQVRWWWRGRLALGKLTVLEGDPDVGKSTILLDLAARVSTGREMPDGTPAPEGPGDVVILAAAEDGLADTVVPRLLAAGADLTRVHVWKGTAEGDGYERGFELAADLPALEAFVIERNVRMVVIDALMAAMPAGQSSNIDPDTRRVLHPFAAMAEKTGAIAIANRHFKKGSDRSTNRGGGSVAIGAVARCVLAVLRDDDDETGEQRLLAVTKANLLPESERTSTAFRLVGATVHDRDRNPVDTARVEWLGSDERRVRELLHRSDDEEGSGLAAECARALREMLEDGPVPQEDVKKQLQEEGFSWSTIRRAQARLKIKRSTGEVFREVVPGRGSTGPWYWRLPYAPGRPPDDQEEVVTWGSDVDPGAGEHVAESASSSGSAGPGGAANGATRPANEHMGHLGHLAPDEDDERRWEHLATATPEDVTEPAETARGRTR